MFGCLCNVWVFMKCSVLMLCSDVDVDVMVLVLIQCLGVDAMLWH